MRDDTERINKMTEYKCFGFICSKLNQQLRDMGINYGYANGYVAIPPDHPLYGKHYEDVNIEIHGGLTFSSVVNHSILAKEELIDGEVPENYWVFGFDTLHWNDTLESCPREYVINEVNELKKILENWQI